MSIFERLEEWGLENYGDNWKVNLAKSCNISQALITRLQRKRIGIKSTVRISRITGIPLDQLGYPGLELCRKKRFRKS